MSIPDIGHAMNVIAERRIAEAVTEGKFDNLPGAGRPLELEDLSSMPADMRMAYTVLKNAGYLDEKSVRANVPASMDELLDAAIPDFVAERRTYGAMRKLKVVMGRIARQKAFFTPEQTALSVPGEDSPYFDKLLGKV